ncbi:cell division protein FtsQ/DivIB [Kineococcus terrestris]|uniref:cell division protein FtsQ/DivIB n=1 Tax=Kineococcus terrestris TaxID=2044856 RepID=UPI0034DB3B52
MARPTRPRTPPASPAPGSPAGPARGDALDASQLVPPPGAVQGPARRRRAVRAAGGASPARPSAGAPAARRAPRPAPASEERPAGAPGRVRAGRDERAGRDARADARARGGAGRGSGTVRPAADARRPDRVADLPARRPGARRARRLLAVVLPLAALVGLAGWVLLGSPWLRVEQVRVTGTARTDVALVERIAQAQVGRPLAVVPASSLAAEVGALPLVESAQVRREWPGTLVVEVAERQAVAAVPSRDGGVDLVDGAGRVLVSEPVPPPGVPLVSVDVVTALPGSLQAALDVNASLPAAVRDRVADISARSPDEVLLRLREGPEVLWGGAERPERKAEVLQRMLQEEDIASTRRVDVSAPDVPAVS